jgi:hypothetical protein
VDSRSVLEELTRLEPIFHTAEFGMTAADFERRMAADYWEVGASGQIYSREVIFEHLEKNPPVDAQAAGWECSGHVVRQLGTDVYLLTYTLQQGERVTQRATIWARTREGLCILYHQGTIVNE